MNRNKNLPLTETVFYILMALLQPAHGYLIMQKVEALSGGQVRLAAGTLYGAIENLQKQGLITPVASPDPRRKVYVLTNQGYEILRLDYQRMKGMAAVFESEEQRRGANVEV